MTVFSITGIIPVSPGFPKVVTEWHLVDINEHLCHVHAIDYHWRTFYISVEIECECLFVSAGTQEWCLLYWTRSWLVQIYWLMKPLEKWKKNHQGF
jgi:hypothetical protein